MGLLKTAILALLSCLLLSCVTPRLYIGVNAFGDYKVNQARTYAFVPMSNVTQNYNLLIPEVQKYLSTLLNDLGYVPVSHGASPEILIAYDFGISGPEQGTYNTTVPVYGQTGSISSTNGTIFSSGGGAILQSNTQTTPTYGVAGYQNVQRTYTVFTRYFKLEADINNNGSTASPPIWFTSAQSMGSSGDLRGVIPYLLTAIRPCAGKNSRKVITVIIYEGDENVMQLVNQ